MDKRFRKAMRTRTFLLGLKKIVKLTKNRKNLDQAYAITRVSTQVKMSQHESIQSGPEQTRV